MIKFYEKHEKVMVVLSIILALVVLGGSIDFIVNASAASYKVVFIGTVLSCIVRPFIKLVPSK